MSTTSTEIHQIAVSGFAEGTNDLYDRARPSYPSTALTYIHSLLHPSKPLTILEPGSGTGIFSRLLLTPPTSAYPKFNITKLIGIEPSSGMRNAWIKGLEKVSKDVIESLQLCVCVEGSFDNFDKVKEVGVGIESVDGVMIAQAWHWCQDHDKALREIAKYLTPGAPLILIWNIEKRSSGLQKDLFDIWSPYDLGSPQYYKGLWKAMFDVPAYTELFEPVQTKTFEWSMPVDEDWIIDRNFSKSFLTEANLKGKEEREQLEKRLRKCIRESKDKEWIDEKAGIFAFKHDCDIFVIRKKK